MFGLGTQELLIVLVLVLIVFGAGRLPQAGAALGKGLRNFRAGVKDIELLGETASPEEENQNPS